MKLQYLAAAVATAALAFLPNQASAAPILVAGPSPVAPFGGTVINFEGQAEGTLITNQYAGVVFSQDDGGAPMIDNLPALFGYGTGSGTGMLTGSGNGGSVATTAGIIATFSAPVSQAGAFMSDTVPLGNYTISAFGAGNVLLESFVVNAASFPGAAECGSIFPAAAGCGVFVGFSRGAADIVKIQFGPSLAARGTDAFAIDDLRYVTAVPEPVSLSLLGLGLAGVAARRARKRA